ncbi:hypothetical protein GPK87_02775 [Oscillibacter sp. MCC667]|nr:hypothetical protein [Oscillibacter sp. MCC667]
MKKFLSLVLALVMTMSLVTVSAGAKDFTDSSKINYSEAVDVLSEAKVIDGYADGAFNPSNTLTRGAAAKIICNLILGPTAASALVADAAPYSDVAANHPFAGYIAYCQKTGIISGYADGTFKPANSLTGYAFMKMLLGALGYDAANEGYTGANWSINVAKQAISIGLNDGLKGEFNGVKAVNREEACLYAFNTLNATMVEYTNQTIVIANGTVKTDKVAKDMENNARTETIKEDNKMQFAEKYFTNLEKEPTSDDFGRPANKWTYKNTDIGTYVDYTLMVAEYTDGVSGKDVYNKIGKTAMDKYDLTATIDGNDAAKTILADVNKNNKDDMAGTDTGVLTQVFVDDDNKAAAIVEINTYLGIADSDYSEKKDEAKFTVWGLSKEGKTYTKVAFNKDGTLKTTSDSASFTVSGEDFNVSKVEEDDAYLFTVAAGEVQTFVPAEAVKDTEITSFKKGSNVTAGGTKYSFNAAAYYDAEVLKDYTDGTVTNLKDTTYNIYLDTYGNLIGLEEVDAVDNYVFITGADNGSSNLSTKTNDANAIFLDGTSKVIEVSNTKGDGVADSPIVNKWFTYTVDKNGVYTLKNIKTSDFDSTKDKVGQKDQTNSSVDIDKKNITLNGNGDFKKVYGNADSIYLTATLKKVKNDKGYYAVISGADNVTTGVKNASIKTWTDTDAQKDVDKNIDAKDWKGTSSGVYTLFKDNGYVIAAVVVGEDAASSKNLVYATKNSVELESYDKNADEWTWTMKAVDAKGQEITLTEVSDSLSELKKIDTKGVWYQVKYDAKGNVISVEKASTALTGKKYITAFGKIEDAIDAEDTVLLETGALKDKLTLKGSTLYGNTNGTRGVVVDDATNVVFIQKNNNKETTSYENGVKAVETALKNLNEVSKGVYKYEFSAIIEDGIATTIVIRDLQADDYTSSTPGGGTTGDVTLVKFDATLRTIELKKADSSTDDDIKNAVKIALADNGYTWTEVTTTSAKAFLTSSSNNNNVIDFTVTVK